MDYNVLVSHNPEYVTCVSVHIEGKVKEASDARNPPFTQTGLPQPPDHQPAPSSSQVVQVLPRLVYKGSCHGQVALVLLDELVEVMWTRQM